MNEENYQAGVCNIGKSEVRARMRLGISGYFLAIALYLAFSFSNANRNFFLFEFIPLFLGAIGVIQARAKFCVAFGLLGSFNFGKLGQSQKVEDDISKGLDRKKVNIVLLKALFTASTLTLLCYLLH
jgi:hypothetical protein